MLKLTNPNLSFMFAYAALDIDVVLIDKEHLLTDSFKEHTEEAIKYLTEFTTCNENEWDVTQINLLKNAVNDPSLQTISDLQQRVKEIITNISTREQLTKLRDLCLNFTTQLLAYRKELRR